MCILSTCFIFGFERHPLVYLMQNDQNLDLPEIFELPEKGIPFCVVFTSLNCTGIVMINCLIAIDILCK